MAAATIAAGVFYNALLAFLNAHGVGMTMPVVIASEALVLLCAAYVIVASGRQELDDLPCMIVGFFLLNALVVSILSESLFIDMARNGAIIGLFVMLGARLTASSLQRCFLVAAVIVAAVIVLELVQLKTYADLLGPGDYFERTRGLSKAEYNELGVFGNALGFEGRFSILGLSNYRVSSLFLEQVSLANFSSVLVIFLVAMWDRIGPGYRWFYIAVVVLILVANNSRTALTLAVLAPMCFWAAPKLGRGTPLSVMPVVLAAAAILAGATTATNEDDLVGRVGLTMGALGSLDIAGLLGMHATLARNFADSGYAYVIYGSSVFGLLFVWLLPFVLLPSRSPSQQRASLLLALFIFFNLLVSGTAVFTIKIGALLWALVGFLRSEQEQAAAVSPSRFRSREQRERHDHDQRLAPRRHGNARQLQRWRQALPDPRQ